MTTATTPTRSTRSTARERGEGARPWLALLVFAVAVGLAAGLGGAAAGSAGSEYASLEQPPFAPPSWLFGPVWTVLYVGIAVAGWLSWRAAGVDAAIAWWVVQLVLNAAWTPIFFGAGEYGWALVEIGFLLVAVVATIVVVRRRSRLGAWLLVPYLVWVGFASVLKASIWWLNR
jgi:tryptophan-rich sensory protein